MASVTHAGTTWNSTAGNKTVVATPAASDLIVVISPYTATITAGVSDNNADGLGTYTQVDTDRTGFDTSGHLKVWVRDALIGSATSTTFTASQPSSTGGGLTVFRVSGMTRTGASAVRSSGGESGISLSNPPAPVLSLTPDTANPIITAVCNGSSAGAAITPRTGYTEASDLGYATPSTGFESAFRNSGETSATLTHGSTSPTTFASVAVELDTTAPPTPAFTVTARHSSFGGGSASSLATSSTTPTADSLFVVAYGASMDAFGTETLPSFTAGPSGGSLSYTLIAKDGDTSPTAHLWGTSNGFWSGAAGFRAAIGGSPSAFAVTVDVHATANAFAAVNCFDITGHDVVAPIVQSKAVGGTINPESDGPHNVSITLDAAPTDGNLLVVCASAGADNGGGVSSPLAGSGKTFAAITNQSGSTGTGFEIGSFKRECDGTESATITVADLGQMVGNWSIVAFEVALASSGTSHTQTPTDNLGLTDSVTVVKVLAQAAIDNLGLTDSTSLSVSGTQLPTDTEALTDTRAFVQSKVRSESLGLTDSVTLTGVYKYVTGISGNGRYFVDQDSNPLLVRGDSPWLMFTALSTSEMDTYLANRQSYGCNLALVSMIGSAIGGGAANGATYDGVLPFTGGDPTVFNSTYWSRMDSYIGKARDRGITLMIYPMDGWNTAFASVVFNPGSISNAQCQTYGQTLATRYLSYPNIIWAFGGDYNEDATINARFNACLTGIRAASDTRPASIQLLYETSESHNSSFWEPIVDWNWIYTYYVTYKGVSDGYNHTFAGAPTARPALFGEGAYENSGSPHFGTDEALRRQACWALTSGSPGELTGQEGVWDFQSGWASLLDTTAADQMKAIRDTFGSLDWWTLVPDDANQLVTAGRGTRVTTDSATFPVSNNYVTAAKAADGTLAVIYLPNASSAITVDMTKIGANPVGTWVDPCTGATSSATIASTYSKGNNSDGDTDWLLILTGDAGTNHTQTPTDNLGLSDSVAISINRSASDAEGLTDITTLGRSQAVAETLGLTDSIQVDKGILNTLLDSLGLTDMVARSVGSGLLDVAALTDATIADLGKAVADSLALTDTTSLVADRGISTADNLGLSDSTSIQLAGAGSVNPTDQLGLTDSQQVDRTSVNLDAESLSDAATAALSVPRSYTDNLGLTDTAALSADLGRAQAETLGLTDSTAVQLTSAGAVNPTDQIGLTDSQRFDRASVSLDNLGLTDALLSALSVPRSFADSMALTDSVNVTKNATNDWAQSSADAVGLTDSIVFSRITFRPNTGRTIRPNTGTTSRP